MMAEDDSSFCLVVYGFYFQANIMKIRLICVFFQGACDGNVKTRRNIVRESKNSEILNFSKIDFCEDLAIPMNWKLS